MGNGSSKNPRGKLRLLPREPLQEKFQVPEEEPGYPPVRHPSTPKNDIYNPQDNRDIYLHALNAPKSIEDSWEDLVHYLTSIYRTDMMKVRSLFSWLGTQSIENETFIGISTPNNIESITPRGYKKVIKDREGSYATFFALLCRKAGLKCAIISGISKGNGYKAGDRTVTHLRDRWNAVYVDGWRIIHPLWAYKAIIGFKKGKWLLSDTTSDETTRRKNEIKDEKILHDFNEYYFLVEPKEFVTVCLPDKPKWQMCNPVMTLDKWLDLPYFQKRYHMEGFRFASEFKSQLTPVNGICGLAIKAPDTDIEYQLSYDFFFNHVLSKPRVDDIIYLKRYVLMSHDSKEKRWSFEARMPVAGTYRITVYGGPSDKTILPWICDVGVYCEEPERNVLPYPDSPLIGFGPVSMTEKAGLTQPSHTNGALFVRPRQTFHITFNLERTIEAKADLVGTKVQEKQLGKWITCTVNNPSTVHVLDVTVKLLEEGEYALKLFTRPKNSNDKWLNVCNYYLSTDPPREMGLTAATDKGYKTAWELNARKALAEARHGKGLEDLRAAVNAFEGQGLYETDGTYGKAAKKLEYLELLRDLRDAINRRNLEALNKAIQNAEESVHVTKLQKLLVHAMEERDELLQLNQFTHAILEMKQSTLSELVSYNKPLPVIHGVLVATLQLLGENKENLKTWEHVKTCMRRPGKDNVIRRVQEFQLDDVLPDVVSDVQRLVILYDEDTVRLASAGAAAFYCWTKSMIEEFQKSHVTEEEDGVVYDV